jgi:hypothetical protein
LPNNDTADKPERTRSKELVQAEEDVARARARVAESVMALRNEVVKRTDWREWIRRRPVTYLAAAFAIGFLWGHRRGAGASKTTTRRTWSWR